MTLNRSEPRASTAAGNTSKLEHQASAPANLQLAAAAAAASDNLEFNSIIHKASVIPDLPSTSLLPSADITRSQSMTGSVFLFLF